MKVKTYGVPGLTEWHGKLRAGSIEVAVSFTGGTASPSGAQPAYFMTKDPIVQFVIEHSKEYQNGFIILTMSDDAPGEHPRMALPKSKPAAETLAPSEEADEPTGESGTPAVSTMEVTCNDDAKEYLMEKFGIKSSELRTKAQIMAAGKEVGVEFVWV